MKAFADEIEENIERILNWIERKSHCKKSSDLCCVFWSAIAAAAMCLVKNVIIVGKSDYRASVLRTNVYFFFIIYLCICWPVNKYYASV